MLFYAMFLILFDVLFQDQIKVSIEYGRTLIRLSVKILVLVSYNCPQVCTAPILVDAAMTVYKFLAVFSVLGKQFFY